jgi:hypothetical protein
VPSHDFAVVVRAQGPAGDNQGPGRIDLEVTAGADVVALEASWTPGRVEAVVTVNQSLFATIEGDPASPVIKGEGGRELTAEELAALGNVFAFSEGIFAILAGILAPVGALLLLGLGI